MLSISSTWFKLKRTKMSWKGLVLKRVVTAIFWKPWTTSSDIRFFSSFVTEKTYLTKNECFFLYFSTYYKFTDFMISIIEIFDGYCQVSLLRIRNFSLSNFLWLLTRFTINMCWYLFEIHFTPDFHREYIFLAV